jgi:hypothetical protein
MIMLIKRPVNKQQAEVILGNGGPTVYFEEDRGQCIAHYEAVDYSLAYCRLI